VRRRCQGYYIGHRRRHKSRPYLPQTSYCPDYSHHTHADTRHHLTTVSNISLMKTQKHMIPSHDYLTRSAETPMSPALRHLTIRRLTRPRYPQAEIHNYIPPKTHVITHKLKPHELPSDVLPYEKPPKYAIPLHDYNTRNIDTTVSIGKEITTTRPHTQTHTLIPPRENQPQQVRERITEALGAPDPIISTISLLDYHTRKHDTPISAITIEGYRNIDFITRLQDTQPPHQTTKLHANHISKPFWGNPFSNMHTTDESDRISLHSYYTRSIDNTVSGHTPSRHTRQIFPTTTRIPIYASTH
jgi:hypothetical protein